MLQFLGWFQTSRQKMSMLATEDCAWKRHINRRWTMVDPEASRIEPTKSPLRPYHYNCVDEPNVASGKDCRVAGVCWNRETQGRTNESGHPCLTFKPKFDKGDSIVKRDYSHMSDIVWPCEDYDFYVGQEPHWSSDHHISSQSKQSIAGWWFGTLFMFPYIGNNME